MKKKGVFCCAVLFMLSVLTAFYTGFPGTEISNGQITAKLYLPDNETGYYRGTRFDWSGVIHSLEYKGHSYFGQWFTEYDPKLHDAIMGPVEEFVALGYNEAKAGEEFVKIGVGKLVKPVEKPYFFAAQYEITDPGKWKVVKKPDRVEFTHELKDAAGYSYLYKKTVRLVKNKPQLVLEHSLKNTGTRAIETSTYNHNFFMIDQEPTGPGITTTFPFTVAAEGKGFGTIANASGNSITYARALEKGENVFTSGVKGLGNQASDYNINIENKKTGAGVKIIGDKPIEKLVFWSCPTTSCPEPYIKLSAKPGEEVKWQISYEFYAKP
ncbi:hypothetical protein DYBT9275_04282 [Dyadobacter sp. CECT 9275]|uniref:Uncharacterized protein n=1 Tax=Dyadobacter helix TaxID=2822344 RepID=A0A916JEY1_9BACT|nr:hypothetical protein [Dyadobacter sp. CECT 9275]CAG5008490.1 hypothetical protein DYBT9275_04282 [Dyadobacter sp. CECT 9275]